MDRCVLPVPTPPTSTTLAASATKPQSNTWRIASRSRSGCASNEKASSVFQHREAGILKAALDTPLPASGHLQMGQLRQVVGRRLALASGLLGQRLPLRRDRRQAQRLQVRRQMRGLGNRGRHQQDLTRTSYAARCGAATVIRAKSGRTRVTGRHTGGGPACCCRRMSRTVSRRGE